MPDATARSQRAALASKTVALTVFDRFARPRCKLRIRYVGHPELAAVAIGLARQA